MEKAETILFDYHGVREKGKAIYVHDLSGN